LRALLLQVLYSIRSERLLMEQLQYNLLFRWFVGLSMDELVWDATVFGKNRERLLDGDIAQKFFEAVLKQARGQNLLSDEHFSVDGTLLEAWASKQSYQRRKDPPGSGSGSRGEMLLRDTHECKTDADARLFRKSKGERFQLCHMVHVLMENRNGMPVAAMATPATTQGEWEAAVEMLAAVQRGGRRLTVGGDAGYDNADLISQLRQRNVTPHFAQHTERASYIDGRATRHPGYEISLQKRKTIERIFGWLKTTALLRKLRHRGRRLVQWMFTLALSAYNLLRIRTLTVQAS
jgi:IS5 family transposase